MRGRRKRKRRGEGGGSILRSKCYFRNSFCPFLSFFVRFLMRRWMAMRMGRRRTEKELYMRGELWKKRMTEEEEDRG